MTLAKDRPGTPGGTAPSPAFSVLLALLAAVALGLLVAPRAYAQATPAPPQCSTNLAAAAFQPLTDSRFQGADGDQCNVTGPLVPATHDWEKLVTDGKFGTGQAGVAVLDDDTAANSVFDPGSKEEEPNNWDFDPANAPTGKKTNLMAAWGYPDPVQNHLFLYMAFVSEDKPGSTNLNIEFNRNNPSQTFLNAKDETIIKRSAGDVLLAYDWSGTGPAALQTCFWKPTDVTQPWLKGTWGDCVDVDATDGTGEAQGRGNDGFPITNFLPNGGGTTLNPGQFGELAIDITAALNLGTAGSPPCVDFGAFSMRTRTSPSITANPVDSLGSVPITVANCGRVIIRKETEEPTPVAGAPKFDFTSTNFNQAVIAATPDTTPAAFQLGHNEAETIRLVEPGTNYTVTEADPSALGYDLRAIDCTETGATTDVASVTNVSTRSVNLKVDPGETVDCTFKNRKRGSIAIKKVAQGTGAQQFAFTTASAGASGFSLGDNQTSTPQAVPPGTYVFDETDVAGWDATSVSCTDTGTGASSGNVATPPSGSDARVTFDVQAGENVVCTVTNVQRGSVAITKAASGTAGESFGFTTSETGLTGFTLQDGQTSTPQSVVPGTYSFAENDKTDWDATAVTCSDANAASGNSSGTVSAPPTGKDAGITFNVQAGENVVCTVTNVERGSVAITKSASGTAGTNFAFTTSETGLTGFTLQDGQTSTPQSVAPGTYSFAENDKAGWDATGVSCSDSGAGASSGTVSAPPAGKDAGITFNVQPGEDVVCTVTNVERGSVAITKAANGTAGENFVFTTTATGLSGFTLQDGQTSTPQSVAPGTYSFAENDKSGWDATSVSCSDTNAASGKSSGNVSSPPAGKDAGITFSVQPGENVVCTVTNVERGSIAITKAASGTAGTNFAFTTSETGLNGFTLQDGQTSTAQSVAPGTYSFAEDDKAGWDATAVTCSDANAASGNSSGTVSSPPAGKDAGITFSVQPGENVVCTVTNVERGSVAITKSASGTAGEDFVFTTSATGLTGFTLQDGQTSTPQSVAPGSYSFAENDEAGWDATAVSCSDANAASGNSSGNVASPPAGKDAGISFNVQPGENVVCTVTNVERGSVAITKSASGTAGTNFAFTTTETGLTGFTLQDGQTSAPQSVAPGTYSFAEDDKAGWDATAVSCSDANAASGNSSGTVASPPAGKDAGITFRVQPGEDVVCTVTNVERGTVAITKSASGTAGTNFAFTTSETGLNGFTLQDSQTSTPQSVKPGTYSFAEDDKAGWDATAVSCSDANAASGNSSGTVSSPPAGKDAGITFNVQPGENVVCTVTNVERGSVAITKSASGTAGEDFVFTTTATGLSGATLKDGETSTPQSVAPGSYSFAENDKGGWDATAVSCSDANAASGNSSGTVSSPPAGKDAGITFNVQPGENVVCTVTNVERGSVAIKKVASGTAGEDFVFTTSEAGLTGATLKDGDTSTPQSVKPGSYSFAENDKGGWDATAVSCSDSGAGASSGDVASPPAGKDAGITFDIQAGENVVCTVTNVERGSVAIKKITQPAGSNQSFAFSTSEPGLNGFSLTDGQTSTPQSVKPGTYAFAEDTVSGWDATDVACDDTGAGASSGDVATPPAGKAAGISFGVQAGEDVVCTVTNVQRAELIVEKQTTEQEGASGTRFAFTTTASGGGFSLADDGVETRTVRPGTYSVTESTTAGYRLENIACTDPSGGTSTDKAARKATAAIAAGETVRCVFTNTKVNAGALLVKTGNEFAYHGDVVTYTFTVTNNGNSSLSDVQVSDDKCSNVTGPDRRGDGSPGTLDPGETWVYQCSKTIGEHASAEANPIVNTATVSAKDELGRPVGATDQHETRLLHPAIAIDKTGPDTASAGDAVVYTLTVTNPGDVVLDGARVAVSDPLCEAPPALVAKRRGDAADPSPETLNPGDAWAYTCTVRTALGQQQVDNVADVTGTDPNGRRVSATDTKTTTLTQPVSVVAAQRAASGKARLLGATGCRSKKFAATVRGSQISKVVWYIDGKKVKTVRAAQGLRTFRLRIDPTNYGTGVHRVRARVTFTAASVTKARTLRMVFHRCRPAPPRFTG